MAETTNILWTDATFNHVIGCAQISAGCKFCYAEADQDNFRGRVKWGVHGTRSVTAYSYWRQALKWNREAKASGKRKKVFCASLADVFEKWDGQVIDHKQNPLWWTEYGYYDADETPIFSHRTEKQDGDFPLTLDIIRSELFKLIERTPYLDWLLLTKRPENIMAMVPDRWQIQFPHNVWMGTTVENQEEAIKRVKHIMKVPARIRFISVEPMLGAIDITNKGTGYGYFVPQKYDSNSTEIGNGIEWTYARDKHIGVDWVICGGESGSNARPMHPDWVRSLRDECKGANIPFLFKQWGEWFPVDKPMDQESPKKLAKNERWLNMAGGMGFHGEEVWRMRKIGKGKAGRMIDGKEYAEFPNLIRSADSLNQFKSDKNAIEMYLRLGYSKSEALDTFCRVFEISKSDIHNSPKYKKIKAFIEKYP